MNIRSITLFCEPTLDPGRAARFFAAARDAFPYPVQSLRLATTPFPAWWTAAPRSDAQAAADFAARWRDAGADYVSLGPVQLEHAAEWLTRIPALLEATDMLFTAVAVADCAGAIDPQRCFRLGDLIREVSRLQENGFGNLYLAALANCPPGSPFFPVAYYGGGAPTFAIAVEAADLARRALQEATTLDEARTRLIAAVETAAADLTAAADELANAHAIPCHGVDFSLAPFPTEASSLGGALEDTGAAVGAPGSLFAAAFITEALARADFRRCGFSGLMLPVLEDTILAQRAAAGQLTVSQLLSYAAVCGVGLDTVPLPGDVSSAALAGVLLDVAALATRLDKPLTARLMPLPGLAAGDAVTFDFPYFADGGVMALNGRGPTGLLAAAPALPLRPLHATDAQTPNA